MGYAEKPQIEITPEMIGAGDAVVRALAYEFWESTTREEKAELLREVFAAMSENRRA